MLLLRAVSTQPTVTPIRTGRRWAGRGADDRDRVTPRPHAVMIVDGSGRPRTRLAGAEQRRGSPRWTASRRARGARDEPCEARGPEVGFRPPLPRVRVS